MTTVKHRTMKDRDAHVLGYISATKPVGTFTVGFAWIRTTDGLLHVHNGLDFIPYATGITSHSHDNFDYLEVIDQELATTNSPTFGGLTLGELNGVILAEAGVLSVVTLEASVVLTEGALQLSGDVTSPGNTYYYGTNSEGVKGFYALPSASYTDAQAQDAVGDSLTDTDTINFSYDDSLNLITADVIVNNSIVSTEDGIALSGDAATPDASYYYGTNSSGTKGFHALPTFSGEAALGNPAVDGYVLTSTALGVRSWVVMTGGGVTDHGALTGLSDDDHTQYVLLAGRASGQTLYGGTAASENLQLHSTAHSTKGFIYLGQGASYDGANVRLGIGDAQFTPTQTLEVRGVVANITAGDLIVDTTSGAPGVTIGRTLSTGGTSTTFNVRNRLTNLRFHVPASSSSSVHITRFDQGGGLKVGSEIQASGFNLTNGGAMLEVAAPAAAAGASNLKTTGSSTTVTSTAAFGSVSVGCALVANGLTRWVVAKASTSSLTVDSAVNWDNGGAGYSWTYTNPLFKLIDNATTRVMINANGYVGLGITTGNHPARLSFVAGTTAADGINFGGDAAIYRNAADEITIPDKLIVSVGVDTPKLTNLTTAGLVKVTDTAGTLGTLAPDADTTKYLRADLTWATPAGGGGAAPFDERVQFIPLEAEKHGFTPYTWRSPYVDLGASASPYACAYGNGIVAVTCQGTDTLKLINTHTGAIIQSISLTQSGYIPHYVTWDGVDSFWVTCMKSDWSYSGGYIKKVLATSPYTVTSLDITTHTMGIRVVGDIVHCPVYNSNYHKLVSRTAVTVSSSVYAYATAPSANAELVYDGTYIIVPDGTNLNCINPSTGASVTTWAMADYCAGGVFDGSHSWWISGTNIKKVSHPDGAVVATISAGAGALGITYPGGREIFFTSNSGTAISTVDMINNSTPWSMGATTNAPYFCCTNHSEVFWCDFGGNKLHRAPMGRG